MSEHGYQLLAIIIYFLGMVAPDFMLTKDS